MSDDDIDYNFSWDDLAADLRSSKKKGQAVLQLAQALEDMHPFASMRDNEELYCYNKEKGIYEHDGEVVIKAALQKYVPTISKEAVREIIEKVRMRNYIQREEFDSNDEIINVPNGLLHIYNRTLTPHSSDYLSMSYIPTPYEDPYASKKYRGKVPSFMKYLRETLDKNQIRMIAKLFGLVLMRTARYELAFLFYGKGSNGKSTMIDIITALVGEHNASTATLNDLAEDLFARHMLYGKMINVIDDLEEPDKIKHTSILKTMISGKIIRAQEKYEKAYQFKNHATIIIASNQPIDSKDTSYAFSRRWSVVNFSQKFEGEDKDVELPERIISNELPIVLNFALGGIQLIKKEGFSDVSIEEARAALANGERAIPIFLENECDITLNEKDTIPVRALQLAYAAYCERDGKSMVDYTIFGKTLSDRGITTKHVQKKGSRERHYVGIKLKSAKVEKEPGQTSLLQPTEAGGQSTLG